MVLNYFARLPRAKVILWCYLLWYLVTAIALFDPSPMLWLNSAGISAVIGIALNLSVAPSPTGRRDRWQTFRLFAMPFCVSSFASLIKGHGYVLIFPADKAVLTASVAACAVFVALCALLRRSLAGTARPGHNEASSSPSGQPRHTP